MNKKCILIILDGWGIAENKNLSAIDTAHTPFIDYIYKKYPHSKLSASGIDVGLPNGQMGNSEVGHSTIGAGRILKQHLVQINDAITDGSINNNTALSETFNYARSNRKTVHLIGLLSDGGIHSHISHAMALCSIAVDFGIEKLLLHAITDGRDTMPGSAKKFLRTINKHMANTTGTIATILGRYYAMDRDKRWERTAIAYNALANGIGNKTSDWEYALEQEYANGRSDEFFHPIIINNHDKTPKIEAEDAVICFNFRPDRMRQLTYALTQRPIARYGMHPLALHYSTLTEYDSEFRNINVAFQTPILNDTLGHIIAKSGKTQLRIAETEKYPHVTYFFSGGQEKIVPRETRILCPSPKVSTYDKAPEMAAYDIVDKMLPIIESHDYDFICANFANADMVGHTGAFDATVKSCEVVDNCLQQIVTKGIENKYTVLIIADHGNADKMIDSSGAPYTAHSMSMVPCILVDPTIEYRLSNGTLSDVAPTVLKILGLEIPKSMSGKSLLIK
jgi:2,3-bisphosphoglycerate-independent phosphoglycerate mutase